MAISRVQKRVTLRRKLHILRAINNSKSVNGRSSIVMNDALYMYKLKVLLERLKAEYANLIATRREYLNLMKHVQHPKDVKVEKVGSGFVVKVNCEKGADKLVTILEAFEEMGLNVQQARVSCNNAFALEAIAVAEDKSLDVRNVTEKLLMVIDQKQSDEKGLMEA
ncbi:Transcription factor bHLH35-like protein [Quillaja saponaria]|uniref:Transcription factor bHLH35-like protein n=1 Tax=Quillaja saponaria TaxID=32244 RepID=A0AAD7M2H0_QUISA|nr:Transcription factor bHLH35-like protein [Quillaja saponaria]